MTATDPNVTEVETGVPFTLNGVELIAEEGELLIEACERNNVHIPRFCYHKRMESVGMCRMCIVEVDTGRGPKLEPSCMLPVTPEMKVETESDVTKHAQDGVLEFLLANHPLDCPVCDKGGECPLQDNAFAYGAGESRFVEEKRHFEKPIPISDLVNLDRERCILCDRCTRFSSEVAGDALIHFIDRGSQTQVNTFPDHPFASYFSGNTVQICPVGALTATPYRFKARPWDLEANDSTSMIDSTGSRVMLQSSQDKLVRILGVDSDAVNWGWISDKERFIFEANSSESRLLEPLVKKGNRLEKVRWNDAINQISDSLDVAPERIACIGGARLSVESQFAWTKLLKEKLKVSNIDAQLGDGLNPELTLSLGTTTFDEALAPDSVVVLLGENLKEILPTFYLRLRHAVVSDGVELVEFCWKSSDLTSLAKVSIPVSPGDLPDTVDSVFGSSDDPQLQQVNQILNSGKNVTVIYSRPNIAESDGFLSKALHTFADSNVPTKFLPLFRRSNSMGALALGMFPDSANGAQDINQILLSALNGEIETLVLLGADPIVDFPDHELVAKAFGHIKNIISLDCFLNSSSLQASVVLPVAMSGEYDGLFINSEARLSPTFARVTSPGQSRTDWMIAEEIALAKFGSGLGCDSVESIRQQLESFFVQNIDWDQALGTTEGFLLDITTDIVPKAVDVSSSILESGLLKLVCGHKLWDAGTMVSNSNSLVNLADEFKIRLNPIDVEKLKLDVTSDVIVEKEDLLAVVPFVSDSNVIAGTIWAPINLPGFDIRSFINLEETICGVNVRNSGGSNG